MQVVTETVTVLTEGHGLTEVTEQVVDIVRGSSISEGLCTVFIQHTSASLVIQENADPSARRDLEYFLNKLVPENDPGFTHTAEGPDDMPSHMKAALTQTALSIPITKGRLVLGTWQGIYLWEHRTAPHHRRVVVSCVGR